MDERNTATPTTKAAGIKRINLALQGGGAHGALTWGILDRLLEDERVEVEGISATSAGALNAACFAYGMAIGGKQAARRVLSEFWQRIARAALLSPLQAGWFDRHSRNWGLEWSPAFMCFDIITRLFSPEEFNPLDLNPLRDALLASVNFEVLRSPQASIRLFISATNVRTGKIKVFESAEMCADAVLASACLPFLFRTVEIDGESYWDGGYMGNPAVFPLIYNCESCDIVVLHINPIVRTELPRTAREILNRVNEISFNSSLMREMRAIHFVSELIDAGQISRPGMKRVLIHAIEADDVMSKLGASSKMNADYAFLAWLRDHGRRQAESWLTANFDHLGKRSTVDVRDRYL
ncbi:MAG: patatin-like phospholipase family protein [Acetobacteraceae bacterium]|nr:patatin-like phospholipase family protein [Acetobacteraceae bacterium]